MRECFRRTVKYSQIVIFSTGWPPSPVIPLSHSRNSLLLPIDLLQLHLINHHHYIHLLLPPHHNLQYPPLPCQLTGEDYFAALHCFCHPLTFNQAAACERIERIQRWPDRAAVTRGYVWTLFIRPFSVGITIFPDPSSVSGTGYRRDAAPLLESLVARLQPQCLLRRVLARTHRLRPNRPCPQPSLYFFLYHPPLDSSPTKDG